MRATGLEVADIFRQVGPAYRQDHADALSGGQRRVMRAIERCRTAALGGHVEQCDACGHQRIAFNSCRDRGTARSASRWCARSGSKTGRPNCCRSSTSTSSSPCRRRSPPSRTRTRPWSTTSCSTPPPRPCAPSPPIPSTWAPRSASSPSCTPGARTCCITRTCTASCPAAGWPRMASAGSPAARASSCRCGCCRGCSGACSSRSCGRPSTTGELRFFNSLAALQDPDAFASYLAPVAQAEWVVYAKAPFGGPQQVLDYLGRYTHRVAISNNRLIDFADGQVAFAWKDYRHESRRKVMRLDAQEFVRRFLLHVLPTGFQRIRHYGLLANRHREIKLEHCRQLLAAPAPVVELPDAAAGLSRPLPAPHRRVAARLPALRAWPDGAHRILPAGDLAARPTAHAAMNAIRNRHPQRFSTASREATGVPLRCSRQWPAKMVIARARVAPALHVPPPLALQIGLNPAALTPRICGPSTGRALIQSP